MIDMKDVSEYVNETIVQFHRNRIEVISKMTLQRLLNKNPYLFRAKNILKASELIDGTLEAFLSSSEEKIFGDFLEDLAIFIAGKTSGGHKSPSQGIDLEFIRGAKFYVVSIKSGTNWGNSSQHQKLAQDFRDATRRLKQSKQVLEVVPTLGICYGNTKTCITRDGYLKVVGQNFWTLISGNTNLYTDIIEPVGYKAKEHNDLFHIEKSRVTNRLVRQFIDNFCDPDGVIIWKKVVEANSGNLDLDNV